MMDVETIQLTILDGGGICFQNGDEMKRLMEAGILRARMPKTAKVHRAKGGTGNKEALQILKRKGVRDLEHYRKIVGNPRTEGPLHRFKSGVTLTMERCPHPGDSESAWYVLLDTAIGATVAFIEELAKRKRVKIVYSG